MSIHKDSINSRADVSQSRIMNTIEVTVELHAEDARWKVTVGQRK